MKFVTGDETGLVKVVQVDKGACKRMGEQGRAFAVENVAWRADVPAGAQFVVARKYARGDSCCVLLRCTEAYGWGHAQGWCGGDMERGDAEEYGADRRAAGQCWLACVGEGDAQVHACLAVGMRKAL